MNQIHVRVANADSRVRELLVPCMASIATQRAGRCSETYAGSKRRRNGARGTKGERKSKAPSAKSGAA